MHESYWLMVYPVVSGQWSGQVYQGDQLVCGIAGCRTAADVEEEAYDRFPELDHVEVSYVRQDGVTALPARRPG